MAVASFACGPVESLVVIGDAKVAIEAARVSDAARFAPFEYRASVEYLHKAREEMNYSDYQAAIELGEISLKYAEGARMRALEHPQRVKPGVTPPPRPGATTGRPVAAPKRPRVEPARKMVTPPPRPGAAAPTDPNTP